MHAHRQRPEHNVTKILYKNGVDHMMTSYSIDHRTTLCDDRVGKNLIAENIYFSGSPDYLPLPIIMTERLKNGFLMYSNFKKSSEPVAGPLDLSAEVGQSSKLAHRLTLKFARSSKGHQNQWQVKRT